MVLSCGNSSPSDIFDAVNDLSRVKLAVLGDSMSAQSAVFAQTWPTKLSDVLNQGGIAAEVRAFAVNGNTFFRSNTVDVYGTNTCVEELVAWVPDVVLVVCGINDTLNPADSRTLAQVQSDAGITFAALRAGLPSAEIYYGAQLAYDNTNFTPATLKNKGVAPAYMTLDSSGILQDLFTSEVLEDALGATKKTEYTNWLALDAEIKGAITTASTITGSFDIDAWKVARLGLLTTDGLHTDHAGHTLLAASVLNGLTTASAPFISNLADQATLAWNNLDTVFAEFLTASGDGYVPATTIDTTDIAGVYSLVDRVGTATWFLPFKSEFRFFPLALDAGTGTDAIFHWSIAGAAPNTQVQSSVSGGAFSNSLHSDSLLIVTDSHGNASDSSTAGALGVPAGTYTFRFKVGNEVFPPAVIVVT